MEYQTLKTSYGEVTITDAEEADVLGLAEVFKAAFTLHNIFQKPKEEVLAYLKDSHSNAIEKDGGYLVAQSKDGIVGGLLLRKRNESTDGHTTWNYNHIGLLPMFGGKGIGSALITAADQKIQKLISNGQFNTAKIETTVTAKEFIGFFEKSGFAVEAELKSHYRKGETAFVLGKEF